MKRMMSWLAIFFAGMGSAGGEVRAWTSSDGKTVEAELVRVEGDRVHLRGVGGRSLVVPMSRLSAADQAVAKAWVAPAEDPGRGAPPSKSPGKDAAMYAEAVVKVNEAHARKPEAATEEELARRLPTAAVKAMHSVLAAPDEAPGLVPALVTLGSAALDVAQADTCEAVRARLEKLDVIEAQRLGQVIVRPRFLVRAVGDFAPGYAEKFAGLVEAVLSAYDEVFGFAEYSKVPGKKLRFRVHRVSEIRQPPHFAPEFPWHSEVDFPVVEGDAFHSPTPTGQFLLYGLCHELGHVVAMWGDQKTMEDHHAWAHYTGVVVVEQLQKAVPGTVFLDSARDVRWRSLTVERNLPDNRRAPGGDSQAGVMAMMIALHDAIGPKAIGTAMNWLDAEGKSPRVNRVRYYSFDGLKRAIEATVKESGSREAALRVMAAASR